MKLGLAEMNLFWEDKKKNKETALFFMEKAKNLNIDLLLFPEMSLTGFSMNVDLIGEENHETLQWFKNCAQRYSLNLGFGCVEKIKDKGINTYYIVKNNTEIAVRYEKIHPFSFGTETLYYDKGENIYSAQVDDFTIAPFICYDLRFPEIFQIASKDAQLITVAANWPEERIDHWHTLLRARAIENQCYIAGVNRAGEGGGLKYSGESVVLNPLGHLISETVNIHTCDNNIERLVIASLDKDIVNDVRNSFKLKADRREDLYYSYYMPFQSEL